MRPLLILPILALSLAACGTDSPSDDPTVTETVTATHSATQEPEMNSIGDTVTLAGVDGTPIKAVLKGVLWADAHAKDSYDGDDQYAVAVAFTLVALEGGQLPAPIVGGTFTWSKGGEQRINADSDTPWAGCTNAYNPYSKLTKGTPTNVIVDLNTPATGGTLTYADAAGPVQWELPEKNSGTGVGPAAKYVTKYC